MSRFKVCGKKIVKDLSLKQQCHFKGICRLIILLETGLSIFWPQINMVRGKNYRQLYEKRN